MIHNHERLLLKLIEQYYGVIPSLTAQILLNHESMLIKRTDTFAKLSRWDFQKGLNVLVRCNLAKVVQIKRYKKVDINSKRIEKLLLYPYYLVIVKEKFKDVPALLLKTLILYGNLSVEDLIERTLFHIILNFANADPLEIFKKEGQIESYINDLLLKFKELQAKNVIVPVEKTTLKNEDSCDTTLICESLKKRFENDQTRNESISSDRKFFWTFNCEVLDYLLFIELFPYFANQPFPNEEANFAFKLLLELTFEKSFTMTPTILNYSEVFSKYQANYPSVKIHSLPSILKKFSHFFVPNFIEISSTHCSLNFSSFIQDITKIIVKEFVKKNHGENAVRIFGALLDGPIVYENDLLNSLKMDSKELHRNLYQLDLNRMINIDFYSEPNQSSTFSARNVKKTFSVNMKEVISYILKRCHYSLYAIMHRKNIEMTVQKDLISRKNHIETYKKEITEHVQDEEERNELIRTAHNYVSEIDHRKAEALLSYDSKVDEIDYNLINYIFILNLWETISSLSSSKVVLDS